MLFDYYYDYRFKAVWTAALRGEVHLRPFPLITRQGMNDYTNSSLSKMIVCLHIFICFVCMFYGLNTVY